ncbi:MAG: Holliday junction resolvase RuvX [Bacteroidota bacterium]
MARLLAFDFGTKRIGLAVTDPEQIVANPFETVRTHEIFGFLEKYLAEEKVEAFVVGMPKDLFDKDSHSTGAVNQFVKQLKSKFASYPIHLHDERFTSKLALDTMIRGGSKKSDRRKKGNIDKISAAIILQSFMEARSYRK